MEIGPDNRYEQNSLVNELTQGMELAKQLRANIGPEFSAEGKESLLQQILFSYDKALLILGSGGGGPPAEHPNQLVPVASPSPPVMASPSISINGSDDLNVKSNGHQLHQNGRDAALKKSCRKMATVRNEQVRLNPHEGIEGPPNDGFNWRKYGQKDILGARYPRSYYRCTYRNMQGCWATRQVQRSDEDPAVFNISYKGKHTCKLSRRSRSAPTSPPGQQQQQQQEAETQQNEVPNLENQYDSSLLMKFQTGLNVNIHQAIDNNDIVAFPFTSTASDDLTTTTPRLNNTSNEFYGSYSPSFISPSTPGTNYFSTPPYHQMETFEGVQQYPYHNANQDVSNIMSTAASATNSPTIEPDLPFEWSLNPGFPFDSDPRFWH